MTPAHDAARTTGFLSRRTAKKNSSERGASMVEMAFVLPVLLLVLFGIMDFGWMFSLHHEMRAASREVARLAAVDNGCYTGAPNPAAVCGTGMNAERDALIQIGKDAAPGVADPDNMTVLICYPVGAQVGVDTVQVQVQYPGESITGFFGPLLEGITLQANAVMRLEQVPTYSGTGPCSILG